LPSGFLSGIGFAEVIGNIKSEKRVWLHEDIVQELPDFLHGPLEPDFFLDTVWQAPIHQHPLQLLDTQAQALVDFLVVPHLVLPPE
jgi:hypothetical protein